MMKNIHEAKTNVPLYRAIGLVYHGVLNTDATIQRVDGAWEVVLPFDYVVTPTDDTGTTANPLAYLAAANGQRLVFKTLDSAVEALESIGCTVTTMKAECSYSEDNYMRACSYEQKKWGATCM